MEENTPYLNKWRRENSITVPNIRERLENDDMVRAGGDCVCEICGKKYIDHSVIKDYEWLNILCNDKIVKL